MTTTVDCCLECDLRGAAAAAGSNDDAVDFDSNGVHWTDGDDLKFARR